LWLDKRETLIKTDVQQIFEKFTQDSSYIEMSFEIDSHFILFTHALEQIAESDRERAIAIDKRDMAELVETVRFLQASED